ncbi:MAG TPA: MFS transporter [Dehalococcoidia bacterium]|nr:MFS transporter [Dehalococcoidia bacterium]
MKLRISPFVLLCIMGGLAIFSSTMAKNPVLPLFIRALDVPLGTVGFIAAASTVVGIVVSLPAGILSDIIGRRRVILIAAIVFASAPFLYLLVTQPWHLVLVRIYHGLATAILGPVAMAAVADTFDEKRGERMGWYSSATMVGRSLAPLVGGALIFGEDFHWVYIATGIIGTFSLAAALTLPLPTLTSSSAREALKRERGKIWTDVVAIVTHRGILATSVVEAVQYFAFGCLEVFLTIYLNEQAKLATLAIGLLLAIQTVVVILTKPLMGRFSDKYGRVPMIITGLLLGGITMAFMTYSDNYLLLALLIGFFGLGLATVTASTAALVADLSKASSHGGALGVLSSVMDIGHSTGPMVGGLLISALNYKTAFGIVGGLLAIASMAFGLIMRGMPRSMSSTDV